MEYFSSNEYMKAIPLCAQREAELHREGATTSEVVTSCGPANTLVDDP